MILKVLCASEQKKVSSPGPWTTRGSLAPGPKLGSWLFAAGHQPCAKHLWPWPNQS